MLAAALLAGAGGRTGGAVPFTLESILLVYGPLGILALAGLYLGRQLLQSQRERAERAEARADKAEAALMDLNQDVREKMIPAVIESNRTNVEVLSLLRDLR